MHSVPPMLKFTHCVRASRAASGIVNFGKSAFLSKSQQNNMALLSGDPFVTSSHFAMRFERSALPADVGGTLTNGTDGHCCLGVNLPALSDPDALWSHYKESLSPTLLAQATAHNAASASSSSIAVPSRTPTQGMYQTAELEAARARHSDSPKSFACFLSHHKQACAAEARLVKQQLESMLDAKVFLGKRSPLSSLLNPRTTGRRRMRVPTHSLSLATRRL